MGLRSYLSLFLQWRTSPGAVTTSNTLTRFVTPLCDATRLFVSLYLASGFASTPSLRLVSAVYLFSTIPSPLLCTWMVLLSSKTRRHGHLRASTPPQGHPDYQTSLRIPRADPGRRRLRVAPQRHLWLRGSDSYRKADIQVSTCIYIRYVFCLSSARAPFLCGEFCLPRAVQVLFPNMPLAKQYDL